MEVVTSVENELDELLVQLNEIHKVNNKYIENITGMLEGEVDTFKKLYGLNKKEIDNMENSLSKLINANGFIQEAIEELRK